MSIKGYKKYCSRCNSKKYRGGSKPSVAHSTHTGYTINNADALVGHDSALANPIPYKAFN